MKSKELREKFTKETGIATVFANRIPYIPYIEWLETKAMKEAQSEILFRFVENVESYPNYEAPYPFRFQMSSEKTKRELEEGKEYSWFEFMGRRHKGL